MASLSFFNEDPAVRQRPNTSDGGPSGGQKLKRPVGPRNVSFKSEHQVSQDRVPRLYEAFAPEPRNIKETQQQVDRHKLNVDP
jgi:hypothetical protein